MRTRDKRRHRLAERREQPFRSLRHNPGASRRRSVALLRRARPARLLPVQRRLRSGCRYVLLVGADDVGGEQVGRQRRGCVLLGGYRKRFFPPPGSGGQAVPEPRPPHQQNRGRELSRPRGERCSAVRRVICLCRPGFPTLALRFNRGPGRSPGPLGLMVPTRSARPAAPIGLLLVSLFVVGRAEMPRLECLRRAL